MVQRVVEWLTVLAFSAMLAIIMVGLGELKRQTEIIVGQQVAIQEYEKLTQEYSEANQSLATGLFQCLQQTKGKGEYQF